jgi:hypothetical protein
MGSTTSIGRYEFLLAYTTFLFFIIQVSAMAGTSIIQNAPPSPTFPTDVPSIIGIPAFVIGNIVYFFKLMLLSSTFGLIGIVLLAPFTLVMLLIMAELLEALIP